jgi:hypothetical protein
VRRLVVSGQGDSIISWPTFRHPHRR